MGGVVIVEEIFDYPGMGRLFFEAVGNRDYPLMQTILLFTIVGMLLANLLADFVVGWLDPRVRKGDAKWICKITNAQRRWRKKGLLPRWASML
ncbi:hypothetical protein KDK_58130 [Dictyobacter kobayashii]|uniref:ABC transmembrane type-1 domain-containing protein n=2 Tax=Dictyobacter kobayashii TaxID=2014872 RepID=A0A402ASJ4_9CHLR|nr:hypothetical protein KDK_58130 [Dictyobacter kobayashii]